VQKIEDIKNDIQQLESILESIDDEETLKNMKTTDPLVIKIMNQIKETTDNK
jgi:chromosomal replication initiation ATPase DnaA